MYPASMMLLVFVSILCLSLASAADPDKDKKDEPFPPSAYGFRKGTATRTHSCSHVREVPDSLRKASQMKPSGLDKFYQKYTEAYGIPVLSSGNVSDTALKRACYVLRFMLADNSAVRNAFYKSYGRVAVKAVSENTTSMPEWRGLADKYNSRAAGGLGATPRNPLSFARVDNVLCKRTDPYYGQDIFLHELAHGVHLLGVTYGIRGWDARLRKHYDEVIKQGLFNNTYATTDKRELFAEMTQSFFNVNDHRTKANGISGPISSRSSLMNYDPVMFELIKEVFPCNNPYLKRCVSTRALEETQILKMDCDMFPKTGLTCKDESSMCNSWVKKGFCTNPTHANNLKINCAKSCGHCKVTSTCFDKDQINCPAWAKQGFCSRSGYQRFLIKECKKSCSYCQDECNDKSSNCGDWAKKGYCTDQNYGASLKKVCRKSCNLC